MRKIFAGDCRPLFGRAVEHQYGLKDIPLCEEVHGGRLYSTKNATLIAYSLKHDWFRGHIESLPIYVMDFDGLYCTSQKRYFMHSYRIGIMLFDYIKLLSVDEALQEYHACEHKLVKLAIPAA